MHAQQRGFTSLGTNLVLYEFLCVQVFHNTHIDYTLRVKHCIMLYMIIRKSTPSYVEFCVVHILYKFEVDACYYI